MRQPCALSAVGLDRYSVPAHNEVMPTTQVHCESCGQDNPSTDDGYTTCCNECLCHGEYTGRYGTPENFKRACCWAKAEIMFGGFKNVPAGSSRLHD